MSSFFMFCSAEFSAKNVFVVYSFLLFIKLFHNLINSWIPWHPSCLRRSSNQFEGSRKINCPWKICRLFDTGSVIPRYQGPGRHPQIEIEKEEQVLNLLEDDSSLRSIARLTGVHKTLKETAAVHNSIKRWSLFHTWWNLEFPQRK